ncbi:MAG: hypothetical protein VX938_10080 [Myxococcota bacterium]|nr:hypothetical protein [Myxococcota bacterium]
MRTPWTLILLLSLCLPMGCGGAEVVTTPEPEPEPAPAPEPVDPASYPFAPLNIEACDAALRIAYDCDIGPDSTDEDKARATQGLNDYRTSWAERAKNPENLDRLIKSCEELKAGLLDSPTCRIGTGD